MSEPKRDLHADLEFCEKASQGKVTMPENWQGNDTLRYWVMSMDSGIACEIHHDLVLFIIKARTGWPYAIRRALAAEKRVAELEEENTKLREQLRDLNEYKRLAEWGLRKIFGEERTVRHEV